MPDPSPGGNALFKIGEADFTSFIVVPSYIVNSHDIYEEYADGNRKFRRKVIRKRITGKFSMKFSDKYSYSQVLSKFKSAQDREGAITATVYVVNTLEVKTSKFFIEFEAADIFPLLGVKETDALEVTIEEQ